MFGCAIAFLTSFQMSLLSNVRKVSQDPHDWEGGLVIHTMAGTPASRCPVSKQQMLFAALKHSAAWWQKCSKCSYDSFSLYHIMRQSIHETGGMCLYCTCCSPCWTDTEAAFHCMNLLCVALPCASKKNSAYSVMGCSPAAIGPFAMVYLNVEHQRNNEILSASISLSVS